MGVAAVFVSLVLTLVGSIAKFSVGMDFPGFLDRHLIVRIKQQESSSELLPEPIGQVDDLVFEESTPVTEVAPGRERSEPDARALAEPVEQPLIDWQNLIVDTVASVGDQKQEREESREQMWRKTGSVMFQSQGGFVPRAQQPVVSDFRFRPQVHVAGLGVTIGSCFIGLPIVGVPVEDRSVAIRLFVCAN